MISLYISFLISLTITFLLLPWVIEKFTERKIVGIDMNKPDKRTVPEMGGLIVIIGFLFGVYSQIILFYLFSIGLNITPYLLASLLVLIGIGYVGLLDDLIGIRQSTKSVLPFFFALPLGTFISSSMKFPIIGFVDFGFLMLIIVPVAVTCASNSVNMLEGFNGLSTGLGLIIALCLSIVAYNKQEYEGLYLLFPLLGALIAFFLFNKYPARIFPGDTFTLFLGGCLACAAFASNLRLECAILLMPMIVEFFLKARGNFGSQCFAQEVVDGVLKYEGRIESLTHVVMYYFDVTENKLVGVFWAIEIILATFVLLLSYTQVI